MQDNSPRRNHRGLCTYEGNKMWNYEILGTDIYHLLAAFVLYSILGWALESTYMSFCNHKLTNRGFGKGPFLPDLRFRRSAGISDFKSPARETGKAVFSWSHSGHHF